MYSIFIKLLVVSDVLFYYTLSKYISYKSRLNVSYAFIEDSIRVKCFISIVFWGVEEASADLHDFYIINGDVSFLDANTKTKKKHENAKCADARNTKKPYVVYAEPQSLPPDPSRHAVSWRFGALRIARGIYTRVA